jgi:pimeloyl-ACP methyl ester carboxylesterase
VPAPLAYLQLNHGRRLAYRTAGEGAPVLYCHGFPSSSHEIDAVPDIQALFPARWIAPDRPGYGGSDHDPFRTADSLADDYAALLDYFQLPKVKVLATSGGTPGLLAFARRHPQRVGKMAVVCGMGFMGQGAQRRRMPRLVREGLHMAKLASWMPDILFHRWSRRFVYPTARALVRLGTHFGLPADKAVFAQDPYFQRVLEETFEQAFQRGGPGMARDLRAWTGDDGAWLKDLTLPVQWWHGTADTVVPFAVGEVTSGAIPGAILHVVDGAGHFSLIHQALPQAIRWLLEAD